MITIHLRYVVDPYKLDEFEEYGRRWITLVNRFGGQHLGYFLPSEGANNIAYALFNFPSLAEYEAYRAASRTDPDCVSTMAIAERSRCILSFNAPFCAPASTASRILGTGQGSSTGIRRPDATPAAGSESDVAGRRCVLVGWGDLAGAMSKIGMV